MGAVECGAGSAVCVGGILVTFDALAVAGRVRGDGIIDPEADPRYAEMSMGTTKAIERALHEVVELLVAKDYAALECLTRGARLRASELRQAVEDYGRTLVMPPPGDVARADVVSIHGSSPQAYSVRLRLFTQDEGPSDLEVQATLIEDPGANGMRVEIDNIIVA